MKKKNAKKGGAAKKDTKDKDEPTKEGTPKDDKSKEEEAPKEEDGETESKVDTTAVEEPTSPVQQSKLRSTSFRQGPLSPTLAEGETAPEIYRKQVARIEDLEKENKRLAKEAADAEKRWQKAEEELADLREGEDDAKSDEVEKLVCLKPTMLDSSYF